MVGYGETVHFTAFEQDLLRKAQLLVTAVPAEFSSGMGIPPDERVVRCHELARAVGKILDLSIVDGIYGIVSHSWLEIIQPKRRLTILDVYVPGGLPAIQLVDATTPYLPKTKLYQSRKHRNDIRELVVAELLRLMNTVQLDR